MKVSKHFTLRQRERNITDQDVILTVTKGVRLVNRKDPNKYTFVSNELGVYVVTDKDLTTLITTFKKG